MAGMQGLAVMKEKIEKIANDVQSVQKGELKPVHLVMKLCFIIHVLTSDVRFPQTSPRP